MIYAKEIKEDFQRLETLLELTEVYGEIASSRMKKIRNFVLMNRLFLDSINDIFKDVLESYQKKMSDLIKLGKVSKGGKVTFLGHNGKTVAVLISANTGFYGEVVQNAFDKFIQDVRKANDEVTIIGKLGLSLFQAAEPTRPYTYFDLPDYGIDEGKLSETIKHLVQYEEIKVFYGKYQSVVTEKADTLDISAGTTILENVAPPTVSYIFEPSVEKILTFFETEIFASLFDQTVREHQLAKFASRIMAMDKASQNIKEAMSKTRLESLKLSHMVNNRKQTNTVVTSLVGVAGT